MVSPRTKLIEVQSPRSRCGQSVSLMRANVLVESTNEGGNEWITRHQLLRWIYIAHWSLRLNESCGPIYPCNIQGITFSSTAI